MKDSAVETAIGAIVIAIAAAFFIFVYTTTEGGAGRGGYRVIAEFDNVGAINVGTDVRLAGIKIGSVVAQELNPGTYQARVTMSIDPKVKLADDTTAKVSSEGILGAPYIALEPGGGEAFIPDGGEIQITQGAIDIWKLVSEALFNKPTPGSSETSPPAANDTAQDPQTQPAPADGTQSNEQP
ncbi:MAG TPA: outer membrane lipid asymmetry maintenance protein MlaD [Aestuariivirgaceae bacterium]|jgi:phospholipid/cholesterol/gamma-HCH transport system substrate-binding protein